MTFLVNMQVDDLHLYLKCHSSADVFQTFDQQKPTTWFILKWNIGRKWVNSLSGNRPIPSIYGLLAGLFLR